MIKLVAKTVPNSGLLLDNLPKGQSYTSFADSNRLQVGSTFGYLSILKEFSGDNLPLEHVTFTFLIVDYRANIVNFFKRHSNQLVCTVHHNWSSLLVTANLYVWKQLLVGTLDPITRFIMNDIYEELITVPTIKDLFKEYVSKPCGDGTFELQIL